MNSYDDFPSECAFCGKLRGSGEGFQCCTSFGSPGKVHKGTLCNDCIRVFIMELAVRDRAEFEKLVQEARDWKSEPSDDLNGNK